jgi:hypothetical protein
LSAPFGVKKAVIAIAVVLLAVWLVLLVRMLAFG